MVVDACLYVNSIARTGYARSDANLPVCVLVFTFIYAVMRACMA